MSLITCSDKLIQGLAHCFEVHCLAILTRASELRDQTYHHQVDGVLRPGYQALLSRSFVNDGEAVVRAGGSEGYCVSYLAS
jgi:hypothetical protein